MSWGAKIKSALHGTVDAADVAALLAASRPLATLRQDLDARRFDLELARAETTGSPTPAAMEWRSIYDLGEIAAPLWLAEELVAVAQQLYDADVAAHPDTPGAMSSVAHSRALALLQPVGSIIVELSAALVDSARRSSLQLPVSVISQRDVASGALSMSGPAPISYVRGLLGGAEQIEGAVQVAVAEFVKVAGRDGSPPWLSAAVQRLRGEMAAAQTRLEMVRARSAPLLNHQALDDTTMHQLVVDLWVVIDTYLRIGQLIASPRLLPGAPAVPPAAPRSAAHSPQSVPAMPGHAHGPTAPNNPSPDNPHSPAQTPPVAWSSPVEMSPPQPSAPPVAQHVPVPPVELDRQIPEIDPIWHPSAATRDNADAQSGLSHAAVPPDPAVRERPLPQIGNPSSSASPSRAGRTLPEIGPHDEARQLPPIGTGEARALPDIGAHTARKPTQPNPPHEEVRALPQIGAPTQPAAPDSGGAHRGAAQKPAVSSAGADRLVGRADRWILTSPATRHHLRDSGQEEQAERELIAFWEAKHWTLSGREQAYRDAIAALVTSGAVVASGQHLRTCPSPPIYRVADHSVQLDGQTLSPRSLFTFDHRAGHQVLRTTLTAQDSVADM